MQFINPVFVRGSASRSNIICMCRAFWAPFLHVTLQSRDSNGPNCVGDWGPRKGDGETGSVRVRTARNRRVATSLAAALFSTTITWAAVTIKPPFFTTQATQHFFTTW